MEQAESKRPGAPNSGSHTQAVYGPPRAAENERYVQLAQPHMGAVLRIATALVGRADAEDDAPSRCCARSWAFPTKHPPILRHLQHRKGGGDAGLSLLSLQPITLWRRADAGRPELQPSVPDPLERLLLADGAQWLTYAPDEQAFMERAVALLRATTPNAGAPPVDEVRHPMAQIPDALIAVRPRRPCRHPDAA